MLSEKLRKFGYEHHDDHLAVLDELAKEAYELETIAKIHQIVVDKLGTAVVGNAIESYLKSADN